jgi:hypothetical protein
MAQSGKYGIPALTYTNFALWRPKVIGLLESKGMQDALTDDEHADSSKALGLIKLLMDDSILSMLNGIDNCRDAWDTLVDLFASTSAANIMQLKRQYSSFIMKGKESIAAYMQRARKLQYEMSAADVDVSDSDLIMTILQGLPSAYDMDNLSQHRATATVQHSASQTVKGRSRSQSSRDILSLHGRRVQTQRRIQCSQ